MKRTALIAGLWLLSSVLWSQTSTIEGLTDATTISESDKVWMVDVSAAGAARDVDATLEQIVSPFAADPSSNSSFDAAEWAADLAITSAWADITGTPTTLSGYGITDAATAAQGALADSATQPGDLGTMAAENSAGMSVSMIPLISNTRDIGTAAKYWNHFYIDQIHVMSSNGTGISDTAIYRSGPGTIAVQGDDVLTTATGYTQSAADAAFATAAQGALAATATQPGDNVSTLTNDAGYLTSATGIEESEVDADIKTLSLPASTTISAFGASIIDDADEATFKATTNLEIGTDVQAFDADLSALEFQTAGHGYGQGSLPFYQGTQYIGSQRHFLQKWHYLTDRDAGDSPNGSWLADADRNSPLIMLDMGDSFGAKVTRYVAATLRAHLKQIHRPQENPVWAAGSTAFDTASHGWLREYNQSIILNGAEMFNKNTGGAGTADYTISPSGAYMSLGTGDAPVICTNLNNPGGNSDEPTLIPNMTDFTVVYIAESGAGSFDINASSSSTSTGFAKQGSTIDADNAGEVEILSASVSVAEGDWAFQMSNVSGTVKILGAYAWNDSKPSVTYLTTWVNSLTPTTANISAALMEDFLTAINPNLISIYFADDFTAEVSDFADRVDTAMTSGDVDSSVILWGQPPQSFDQASDSLATEVYAMSKDWGFEPIFFNIGGSYAKLQDIGEGGDGLHPTEFVSKYTANNYLARLGLPTAFSLTTTGFEYNSGGDAGEYDRSYQLPEDGALNFKNDSAETVFIINQSGIKPQGDFEKKLLSNSSFNGVQLNPVVAGDDRIACEEFWSSSTSFTLLMAADIDLASSNSSGNLLYWASGNVDVTSVASSTVGGFEFSLKPTAEAPTGSVGYKLIMHSGDGVTAGQSSILDLGSNGGQVFIAVTYDHSTGAINWFIDGERQTEITSGTIVDWNAKSLLAPTLFNDPSSNVRELSGAISYFGAYDAVLTDAEIASIYNEPRTLGVPTSIKAGYVFEDRTGSYVSDVSGNNNHGTISGSGWSWLTEKGVPTMGPTGTATIDFASIATDASATNTITVTGAVSGDTVLLQPQQIGGVSLYGHVSAADTVTVTAINHSAGAIDPASTSIRATVIKP